MWLVDAVGTLYNLGTASTVLIDKEDGRKDRIVVQWPALDPNGLPAEAIPNLGDKSAQKVIQEISSYIEIGAEIIRL